MLSLLLALQVFGNANDPSLDKTAPTVTITSPTSAATYDAGSASSVTLSGTSSDANGIAICRATNALTGITANATTTATGAWSMVVSLNEGSNAITVTCLDPGNNQGTDLLTVTRASSTLSCASTSVRCVPSEYATIQLCAAAAVAGETCLVSAGTYSGNVSVTRSGTLGNTITFVGAAAPASVILNGTFTTTGNYVRIIGFTMNCGGANACVSTNDSDGIEVWNSTFSGFVEGALVTTGPIVGENDDNIIFLGNVINGVYGVDNQQVAIYGSHNLAAYNTHNMAGNDYYTFYGPGFRVFNNYAWGPAHTPHNSQHSDFVQTGWCCSRTVGTEGATIEANFYVGNPPGDNQHFSNQETSPDNSGNLLYRRNVIHNNAGGAHGIFNFTTVYIAQETYIDTQVSDPAGISSILTRFATFSRVQNSLFQDVWNSTQTTASVHDFDGGPGTSSFNLAWDASIGAAENYCCVFGASATNIKTQQPLFVDYANDSFQPTAASPVRNAAGALTTVSGSGTGTTFTVASGGAGFFRGFDTSIPQYGGNLAAGDIITIGTDVRRISSISGNNITVTSSFTWANGDGVYYGDNAVDNAIGAHPYRASWTLTGTYTCNATICTVVSSDPTITRMVICYSDRIPYQVVIDSPYVCSLPSGTFEARVYPLYASTTLWAVATGGSAFYIDSSCPFNGTGLVDACPASAGAAGRMNDLQAGLTAAVAGDTVIVHAGTYTAPAFGSGYTAAAGFRFTSSGTSGRPITLKNAPGERPILRACASGVTTIAGCNRPVLTAFGLSYVKVTSDSCSSSSTNANTQGLHVIGLVILYDDGTTEGTMANGNEVSCTEIEQGYSSADDGNWSGLWLQGQLTYNVFYNNIHDITSVNFSDAGGQSSTTCIKLFQATNGNIFRNTCNHVNPTQAGGIDCKADCVNVTMEQNDIRDVSICLRVENQETVSGPYTANGTTGSIFRNNLCVSAASSVRGGVRIEDGKTTSIAIYNNTFANFIYGLEEIHSGTNTCQGVTHYNNAYYNSTDAHIYLGDGVGTECTFTLSNYNIFGTAGSSPRYRYAHTDNTLANYKTASGFDTNSTELAEASFGFTNVAGGFYTLGGASALLNAGRVGGTGSTTAHVGAYTSAVTCVGYTCTTP